MGENLFQIKIFALIHFFGRLINSGSSILFHVTKCSFFERVECTEDPKRGSA